MSFTLTNNSSNSVITGISTQGSTYGTFTITGGTFPLFSGNSISGTNTTIQNKDGSPYGTLQLYLLSGDAQIEVNINGQLMGGGDYSSGICEVTIPILQPNDNMNISIDEAILPFPSQTPTNTPTPSVTPSVTPSPTPSGTPSVTPSPTPSGSASQNYKINGYGIFACDYSSNLSGATGATLTISGQTFPVVTYNNTPPDWNFGTNVVNVTLPSLVGTGTTIEASFFCPSGFSICNGDGLGFWDRSTVTFGTKTATVGNNDRYIAIWNYYSGSTLVFTETSSTFAIVVNTLNKIIDLPLQGGLTEAGYFAILPNP